MGINGKYKINIEMTARKQVLGVVATAQGLLGKLGAKDLPIPAGVDDQINAVANEFRKNQDIFDQFEMVIADDSIIVRTGEGELRYEIVERRLNDQDANRVVLCLRSDEMGEPEWDVTLRGNYFLFDSVDGLSEYAFEKTA